MTLSRLDKMGLVTKLLGKTLNSFNFIKTGNNDDFLLLGFEGGATLRVLASNKRQGFGVSINDEPYFECENPREVQPEEMTPEQKLAHVIEQNAPDLSSPEQPACEIKDVADIANLGWTQDPAKDQERYKAVNRYILAEDAVAKQIAAVVMVNRVGVGVETEYPDDFNPRQFLIDNPY